MSSTTDVATIAGAPPAEPPPWVVATCHYTPRDVKQYVRVVQRTGHKWSWHIYVVIFLVSIIGGVAIGVINALTSSEPPPPPGEHPFRPLLMALPLWVFLMLGANWWQRVGLAKRYLRQFSPYQRPRTFIIGPRGVSVREPLTSIEYVWPAFYAWRETADCFILYTSVAGGELLTKRAVGDAAMQEWLRGALRTCIDAARLVRPAFPVQGR